MTELQVSDVYVRLGNDFNAAVAAFGAYSIDMRLVAHSLSLFLVLTPRFSASYFPFPTIFEWFSSNAWLKTLPLPILTNIYQQSDK
jgi:hypothetical protein